MAYYNGKLMSGEEVYRMFLPSNWPFGGWKKDYVVDRYGLPVYSTVIWLHRNWGIPNG